MFSRLKTKMLKIFLCLDKSEMTDLQMKKAIVILSEMSIEQHMMNLFRRTIDIDYSKVR